MVVGGVLIGHGRGLMVNVMSVLNCVYAICTLFNIISFMPAEVIITSNQESTFRDHIQQTFRSSS